MTIDIHAHYVPAELIARVRSHGENFGVRVIDGAATPALQFDYGFKVRPMFPKLVDPVEQRVAWLDSQSIDHQLVATWPDVYGYGLAREQCAAWHRVLNDTLAAWCAATPQRFGFIGSVPLPNAEDAAAELARALDLGAVGVMLSANVEGTNIGELALDPLWAKAEALSCPIIVHPVLVGPAPRAAKFGMTQSVQYTFDTTLGTGSLLFSGVLDRFPRLTFVLSHGGGAFPYLAGRFDIMHARMDRQAQADVAAQAPTAYASRFAYDSIVHGGKALRFLAELVGIERVMLGTDYSFPPADLTPLTTIRAAGFSAADAEAIAEGNARRLFSRLRT
ncbi:MAG TPA: amidohydrolase family protein [Pseudolabrys sp.]|nr:amidohydrolase family protein [Pseudolabrys sp.]